MIESAAAIAKAAITLLHNHLLASTGKAAATGAAEEAGKNLFSWFKAKLTGPSEADALAKMEANPQSGGASTMLRGALEMRLESDPELLQELVALLKESKVDNHSVQQKMKTVGDNNASAQVAGNNNTVNINRG